MSRTSARRIVLVCEECGERTVLAGPESVWRSESTFFECGCGRYLTLAALLSEEDTTPLASLQGRSASVR